MATETTVARPRVFVSSTIADMRDLRDAAKFWLEEMGYEVQLSEHNDFMRRPDAGTFDACFEAIRESDYYVLLIGGNRGSWYDESERVTVTGQEYRTAYESWNRSRKPKIVAFVRREVGIALRERAASGAAAESPSAHLKDARFTEDFVAEVRRERETKEAAKGDAPHPESNWLSEFSTFRELTDGLRGTLRIRGPLQKVAIVENLRRELERNLRLLMSNFRGHPFYHHFYLDDLREAVRIETDNLDGDVPLSFEQVKRLDMYVLVGAPRPEVFVQSALNEAILSGALLDFDTSLDRFVPSALLETSYRLREELDVYASRHEGLSEIRQSVWQAWNTVRQSKGDGHVSGSVLTSVFGLHDSQRNIVRLLVAMLRHLYEHTQEIEVQYRPTSPIAGEDERIEKERVSQEQLRSWLEVDSAFLRIGTTDRTEEQRQALEEQWKYLETVLGKEKAEAIRREVTRRIMGSETTGGAESG